jgi:DNA-binding transcriptional regulator YbjK
MSIESTISKLNERMAKHYLQPGDDQNVIAVCLFVNQKENFVQGWFSRFDGNGHQNCVVDIDDYTVEARNINEALQLLTEYVDITDAEARVRMAEAEKTIEENGFGD